MYIHKTLNQIINPCVCGYISIHKTMFFQLVQPISAPWLVTEPLGYYEAVCHDGVHATVRADLLRRDAGEHFYLSGPPGSDRVRSAENLQRFEGNIWSEK